jgi:hypothetical protein
MNAVNLQSVVLAIRTSMRNKGGTTEAFLSSFAAKGFFILKEDAT